MRLLPLLCYFILMCSALAAPLRSVRSGPWSSPETWADGKVPGAGAVVLIRPGDRVIYDVENKEVLRAVHIGGTLVFSQEKDTMLCAGLVRIAAGEECVEEGFDCHAKLPEADDTAERPALEIGTPVSPLPAERRAIIRLTYIEGMDRQTFPALVCCGGRMDLHGAPLAQTWVKLGRTNENSYEFDIHLAQHVEGWRKGDRVVLTGTRRPFPAHQYAYGVDANERPQTETVVIHALREENGHTVLEADDYPPSNRHEAGPEFAGEVGNLSRNVIVESADPKAPRGHTMYHRGSTGSISYAEFRHLGKEGVFGRYPIHFHLCGDTMRGASVIGASIWDSGNRFLTIHATDYLVVRDCVGFKCVGHGFFLEGGTETRNILDHNLASLVLRGKKLPDQELGFDDNDGAGFWWANSLNSFTRNVAAECDQHGYRFEVVVSPAFNGLRSVRQPDGTKKDVDLRTIPFLRFEQNEAHCMPRFGINLGGYNGQSGRELPEDTRLEDVDGVGPDSKHPFVLRDTRLWDCDWAYHSGSPSVLNRRMTIYRCLYGIWRINAQLQEHDRLTMTDLVASGFFYPRLGAGATAGKVDELEPVDDFPPITIITDIRTEADGRMRVSGSASDNNDIRQVLVNGQPATATSPNFATWQTWLSPTTEVTAGAVDDAGNREMTPHRWRVRSPAPADTSKQPGAKF